MSRKAKALDSQQQAVEHAVKVQLALQLSVPLGAPAPADNAPGLSQLSLAFQDVGGTDCPVLTIRGVLPWYNFFNSPTAWDPIDHRAFADQLIRMGANFVGFHTYDSEPFAAFTISVVSVS